MEQRDRSGLMASLVSLVSLRSLVSLGRLRRLGSLRIAISILSNPTFTKFPKFPKFPTFHTFTTFPISPYLSPYPPALDTQKKQPHSKVGLLFVNYSSRLDYLFSISFIFIHSSYEGMSLFNNSSRLSSLKFIINL